jgi:UDPglucose 6-dehydrogenase
VSIDPLRLTVIGTGYLGLTHAVCMADLGHQVLAIDADLNKLELAAAGHAPFFEPGLEPLLRKNIDAGRLRFTNSYPDIGAFGQVHFLCVGTPQRPGGEADLSQLHAAADSLAPHLFWESLVVGKSTVPVGTARNLLTRIRYFAPAGSAVNLAWNPEFLREGHAVADSLTPDRIVLGVQAPSAETQLREVYATQLAAGVPLLVTGLETAELVKVSATAFLATKISFINMVAEVCEKSGADVLELADAIGLDARIGRNFLSPGLGFGGGCLPKDIRAFQAVASRLGAEPLSALLSAVDQANLGRRERVLALASAAAPGGSLRDARVAVLGLAFKPGSDDIRDSPSLDVCARMAATGAIVTAHDPVAVPNAARVRPELRYAASVAEAAEGADVVLHLTDWPDYRSIDPAALKPVVARPVLVDARCTLDAAAWTDAGWTVRSPGRPSRELSGTYAAVCPEHHDRVPAAPQLPEGGCGEEADQESRHGHPDLAVLTGRDAHAGQQQAAHQHGPAHQPGIQP